MAEPRSQASSLRLGVGPGRLRARDELRRLQDRRARPASEPRPGRGPSPACPRSGASHISMSRSSARYLIAAAIGDMAGERSENHRADDDCALIAAFRPDAVEPLEGELQIVTHAAVEHRNRCAGRPAARRCRRCREPASARRSSGRSTPRRWASVTGTRSGLGTFGGSADEFLDRAGADHHAHFVVLRSVKMLEV